MPDLPEEMDRFIAALDGAVEAHMNWTRRILRCAVLRTSPGEDVLDPGAHTLCQFGAWFTENRGHFEALDAPAARQVETVHRRMHDAIRALCNRIMDGLPGEHADLDTFEASQSELITLLAGFKTKILSQAVRYDPLTKLPLRYNIESDFLLYQKDARRNRTLLYVAMIDVDHFKSVNDTYGHLAGDRALCHLADTLKSSLRSDEPLYRYGGEEFLWLLKCKSPEEARQSAKRVLAAVGSTPVPINDSDILRLTITLGLARVGEHEALSSAVERADQAMYEGKRSGRNRFVFADG